MENILLMDGDNIRRNSRIANSFGDKALSWISGADAGSLAASLLIDADVVKDRILIAGGVERLAYEEVASKISAAVGKPVRYEQLTPERWREELMVGAKAKGGEVNVRGIDHLVAQSIAMKSAPALPVTDHVRQITGREPVTFSDFVKQHLTELTPSTLK